MIDSGAARTTCPPQHAPTIDIRPAQEVTDLRTIDDRTIEHIGQKTVTYGVPEAQGVAEIEIDWQVADVSHPVASVAEANDLGHSVLFSPNGSYVVPMTLELPASIPRIPLRRHQNLFWMHVLPTDGRRRAAAGIAAKQSSSAGDEASPHASQCLHEE